MIRTSTDFYSYLFQQEQGITAVYFITNTETEYRVYFYPISEYFEGLGSDTQLFHYGYFFGFTKLAPNETKVEPLDFKIRNTILKIIEEFFEERGHENVLIFYCDNDDGKKSKRSICFDAWYLLSGASSQFNKYDEVIIFTDEYGTQIDSDYISLIVASKNHHLQQIVEEFQLIKQQLNENK